MSSVTADVDETGRAVDGGGALTGGATLAGGGELVGGEALEVPTGGAADGLVDGPGACGCPSVSSETADSDETGRVAEGGRVALELNGGSVGVMIGGGSVGVTIGGDGRGEDDGIGTTEIVVVVFVLGAGGATELGGGMGIAVVDGRNDVMLVRVIVDVPRVMELVTKELLLV